MTGDLSPLFALVRRIERECERRIISRVKALPQQRVLMALAEAPGTTDRVLRDRLAMSSGQMSIAATALRHLGFVEEAPAPGNQLQRLLSLTPDGEREAAEISRQRLAAYKTVYDALSPAEQWLLSRVGEGVRTARTNELQPVKIHPLIIASIPYLFGVVTRQIRAEHRWPDQFVLEFMRTLTVHADYSSDDHGGGWVARQGSRYVGMCLLTPGCGINPISFDSGAASIHVIHVSRADRRRGHATRLLNEAMNFAEDFGYGNVHASLPFGLVSLRRFLERQSFKPLAPPQVRAGFNGVEKWLDLVREVK